MTKPLIASTDQNSKRFLRQGRETLGRKSVQLHQGRLKTQRGTADSRQRVAAVVARHEATRGDVEVGFLTKVKQMPQLGPVKLFWIDMSGEKMSADLAQKVPRYLQICEIVDSNGMATESRLWPLEAAARRATDVQVLEGSSIRVVAPRSDARSGRTKIDNGILDDRARYDDR
jgi:hypothetical protein